MSKQSEKTAPQWPHDGKEHPERLLELGFSREEIAALPRWVLAEAMVASQEWDNPDMVSLDDYIKLAKWAVRIISMHHDVGRTGNIAAWGKRCPICVEEIHQGADEVLP